MLLIRLLGVLQISLDGEVLPSLPTQKAIGLFGYITLNTGKELSREHLAELFWPDRPRSNARRSLHTALWQIRALLKDGGVEPEKVITTSGNTICWNPQIESWLDVHEFEKSINQATPEKLQNAIDLYRGSFLSNVYEDWCLEERYRLEAYYLRALTKLINFYLVGKRFSAVIEVCRLLLKADPLNEIAHRGLMVANYQLGARAAAIEQFYECERLLKRELNIQPSEETWNLFRSIQNENIAYDLPVTGALPTAQVENTPANAFLNSHGKLSASSIFGRQREFLLLKQWWTKGEEVVALIRGEQGVGKTRLAHEFIESLKSEGVMVGWGQSLPVGQDVPHYSIQMALINLMQTLPATTLESIPQWQATEISHFVPEMAQFFKLLEGNGTESLDQNRIYTAICNIVDTISQSVPILMVIDDINWASQSTIHLIEFLVRYILTIKNKQSNTVRFLVMSNDITVPSHHSMSVIRLRRDKLIFDLELNPLSPEDVSEWIKFTSGEAKNSQKLADALYNKTLGNPLFIHETLEALFENGKLSADQGTWAGAALKTGPLRLPLAESIKQLIEARLQLISQGAIEVAYAGAVIGSYFDVKEVVVITGRDEESVLKDLGELVTAQIIEVNSPPKKHDFEFSHHLIQQAIYETILPPARTLMHRKLARKLIDEPGERAAPRILYHYRKSKDLEAVVHWSLIAGKQAIKMSDYESAALILQQAEEIGQEIEIPLVTMAEIISLLGETFTLSHEREKIFHYAKRYADIAQQVHIQGWQETSARWMRIARLNTSELNRI